MCSCLTHWMDHQILTITRAWVQSLQSISASALKIHAELWKTACNPVGNWLLPVILFMVPAQCSSTVPVKGFMALHWTRQSVSFCFLMKISAFRQTRLITVLTRATLPAGQPVYKNIPNTYRN